MGSGGAHQGRVDQRHHEADHGEGQYPRDQRPVFQARIPDRPDRRQHQGHPIQPGTTRVAPRDQQPGHQHRQAHQQEIGTAAQAQEVTPACGQAQPDQGNQDTQPPEQPFAAGGSPRVFHLKNSPIFKT